MYIHQNALLLYCLSERRTFNLTNKLYIGLLFWKSCNGRSCSSMHKTYWHRELDLEDFRSFKVHNIHLSSESISLFSTLKVKCVLKTACSWLEVMMKVISDWCNLSAAWLCLEECWGASVSPRLDSSAQVCERVCEWGVCVCVSEGGRESVCVSARSSISESLL